MQKNITVWFSVPSVGLMMKNKGLLKPNSLPTLRLSLFCGEALTAELAEHWQLAAPNSILENLYGPTELTIACAAYQWNPKTQLNICKNGIVPIGKIYSSLPFVIINQNNEIVEKGSIGELCVSGVQMFKGYLKNDFNPFLELKDKNGKAHFYYKTGDLVQETMTDGLVFLGRKDQQVKVNGYRIELGEIENAIRTLYHADTAVALAVVDLNSSLTTLIAFVGGDSNQNKEDIKKLQQILPHYMIPKEIHWVSEFPLNINGKIDRKVLLDGWKKSKNEKPKKTERECVCEC